MPVVGIFCVGCNPQQTANNSLLTACEDGNLSRVHAALKRGADPNAVDHNPYRGFSALDYGITHPGVVKALLAAGAKATCPDATGILPLTMAASAGSKDSINLLLDAGAAVDQEDEGGRTALSAARDPAVIKLLIARGAEVNHADHLGFTALHSVIVSGCASEVVEELLKAGADPFAKDKKGRMPLFWAGSLAGGKGSPRSLEISKLLKKAQAARPNA